LNRAFSLLKAIWGQEMQHITDRLTEAFACGLVRDVDRTPTRRRGSAEGPYSTSIPLRGGSVRPDAAWIPATL
jgi:hypothetical protein